MVISFACANARCKKPLKAKDDLAGRKFKCPSCGSVIEVPAAREERVQAAASAKAAAPPPKNAVAAGQSLPEALPARPTAAASPPPKATPAAGDHTVQGWEQFKFLKQPAFVLKIVRPGFVFKQFPPKRRYTIQPVESEQILARGCEQRHFLWVVLRSLLPFWFEFREENGPPIFRVRSYGWPLPNYQFVDVQGRLFARFKAKGFQHALKMGGFWVYDANDAQIGEVKAMNLKWDTIDTWSHWGLVDGEENELVQIIDEVDDACNRKGGSSGWVTDPGGVVRFPGKQPADAFRKILGLAAALVLELDGIRLAPKKFGR
jgi:hypothetical protein